MSIQAILKLITALVMALLGACGTNDKEDRFIDTDLLEDRIQRGVPQSDWCFDSTALGLYENGFEVKGDCTFSDGTQTYKITSQEGLLYDWDYNRQTFGDWIEDMSSDLCNISLFNETLRMECNNGYSYTGRRIEDRTLPAGSDPYPITHLYE
jgi:hypothetical protein